MTFARGDERMLASLSRCFRCGAADLADKNVEELVRSGKYVVAVRVKATVCDRCGERYFDGTTLRLLEGVRERVGRGDLAGLQVTGQLLEPIPG
jgi:YgiT-type zinc finger domain-containing protein